MDTIKRKEPRRSLGRKPIGLALQGGGSLGAYTWGVLDALLASHSVAVTQLSGTSAGAIKAAIVASALATGSRARGGRCGHSGSASRIPPPPIWCGAFGVPSGRRCGTRWAIGFFQAERSTPAARMRSLRDAVSAHVDFDAIHSKSAPALFVTVTNVKTGLPHVISNADMSVDVLLASASLPQLFPAVELDSEYYWDGGYAGNPTVWPMIQSGLADDLVLVQLVPNRIDDVPVDTRSIRRRVSEIVFNASLVAEMQALTAMRGLDARGNGNLHVADVRLHRIGPPGIDLLEEGTALDRGRIWLKRLHEEGLASGKQFMAWHGADIGLRETLDVADVFVDAHTPRISARAVSHARRRSDFLESFTEHNA